MVAHQPGKELGEGWMRSGLLAQVGSFFFRQLLSFYMFIGFRLGCFNSILQQYQLYINLFLSSLSVPGYTPSLLDKNQSHMRFLQLALLQSPLGLRWRLLPHPLWPS